MECLTGLYFSTNSRYNDLLRQWRALTLLTAHGLFPLFNIVLLRSQSLGVPRPLMGLIDRATSIFTVSL